MLSKSTAKIGVQVLKHKNVNLEILKIKDISLFLYI